MSNNTNIDKIIDRLEYFEDTLPRIALQNAINEQEAITPHLLASIKESTISIERVYHDADYMLFFYAIFLLSQFREKKAFPLLIDFFSTDAEMIEEVLDDFATEGVSRALASTYDGNLDLLKGLIENEEVNEYIRSGAKETLTILHLEGILSREEVIEYYRSLFVNRSFGDNGFLYGSLVIICSDLSADELRVEIEDAFKEKIIDETILSIRDYYDGLEKSHDEAFQILKKNHHYSLIDDTIGELSTWAAFQEEKPKAKNSQSKKVEQAAKTSKKIGRNEPCPCGSGKKYKKCCIKKGIY